MPEVVVNEFHRGIECAAVEQKREQYGQEASTFLVETDDSESPHQKKQRRDQPVLTSSNEGWVNAWLFIGHAWVTIVLNTDVHVHVYMLTAILAGAKCSGHTCITLGHLMRVASQD